MSAQGIEAIIFEAFLLLTFLLLAWKPERITAIFATLNSVNSQVWAFLILITGLGSALLFHKNGLDIAIAAGVIGAAVNMFNSLIKPQPPGGGQHLEMDTQNPSPLVPPVAPDPTKK